MKDEEIKIGGTYYTRIQGRVRKVEVMGAVYDGERKAWSYKCAPWGEDYIVMRVASALAAKRA